VTSVQLRIAVHETSQIGEVRRASARLASEAHLDEQSAGRLAIVANELATNLVRHALGGEILLQRLATSRGGVVEVLAIDKGPGMADPERCMRDGYSTNGTSGNGLGAVQRLSETCEVYSRRGSGTVVVSRIGAPEDGGSPFGVINLPYPGEVVCGDAWSVSDRSDGLSLIVVDGLGHGPHAAAASAAAIEAFEDSPAATPTAIIERAHSRMTATRGGAVAIARYDGSAMLRYGSVGNIAGTLFADGKPRGLSSQNGTVGAQIRHLRTEDYPCPPGSLLVLHSDGLTSRWTADPYPGVTLRHPSILAALLYRDFRRERDDVTVLVVRMAAY
jgi:anti-sigma regulatory factor (Ser/Thr protein kinase)